MSNLSVFEFQDNNVRIALKDGKPWFCLIDVCKILGINNTSDVLQRTKKDGVDCIEGVDSLGRKQVLAFIDEANLYRVIFQSKKKNATAFQDWVFEEVLPQIRETGSYSTKPKTSAELAVEHAQLFLEQERRQLALETEQKEQAAKLAYIEQKTLVYDAELQRIHSPYGDRYTIMGYANITNAKITPCRAMKLGKLAATLCNQRGIAIEKISDMRFGKVGTYPQEILEEVFEGNM